MKRVSILVASSVLLAFSGSSVEAAKVTSRDGCVNLRSQPSMNAEVIRCLPSGTNLEPYRSPGSGRFTWQKEGDRVWYYTSVPGMSEKGWIMPDCTDINGINKGACTDTDAATPLAKPQAVAQAEQQEEVLKNPSWKVVPGAAVGKNPADTLMNLNSLNRNGNTVTFDIIGYQGFYNRLEGNCSDRRVRFLRRGINRGLRSGISEKGALDLYVNYRSVTGEEASGVNEFHRKILDFACKQSQTQVASSPAKGSTQAVGNYKCQKIQGGSSALGNPIQRATLEPRTGGYTLRFTEMVQGQPIENVWDLDNRLLIENVRFDNPDDNTTPVKIQPSGEFSKTFMASSQDKCTWTGTLQFVDNAQAQLFPGSSTLAQKLAQPASSTGKITEGRYWVGLTGMVIEVKGQQYQFRDEETTTTWKPISELTYIKDGVFKAKAGETYWCLSNSFPQQNRSSVCSANGWTASSSVASKPAANNPSTSNPPFISSPIQIVPAPKTAPVVSPAPSPTPSPTPSPQPKPSSDKPAPPSPNARVIDLRPLTVPAAWSGGAPGQGNQPFPDASSACRSFTSNLSHVSLKLTDNQIVYAAECHAPGGFNLTFVHCPDQYGYTGGESGVCRRNDNTLGNPLEISPVAQQPPRPLEASRESLPVSPAQKPEDIKGPTPSPTPPSRQSIQPSNQQPSVQASSERQLPSKPVPPIANIQSVCPSFEDIQRWSNNMFDLGDQRNKLAADNLRIQAEMAPALSELKLTNEKLAFYDSLIDELKDVIPNQPTMKISRSDVLELGLRAPALMAATAWWMGLRDDRNALEGKVFRYSSRETDNKHRISILESEISRIQKLIQEASLCERELYQQLINGSERELSNERSSNR